MYLTELCSIITTLNTCQFMDTILMKVWQKRPIIWPIKTKTQVTKFTGTILIHLRYNMGKGPKPKTPHTWSIDSSTEQSRQANVDRTFVLALQQQTGDRRIPATAPYSFWGLLLYIKILLVKSLPLKNFKQK